MSLKELRKEKGLTQAEAAKMLGVSLRSYITYERDGTKTETIKYRYLLQELEKATKIDEKHGILSMKQIIKIVSSVLSEYDVNYCYLFGSYCRNEATDKSDVDLLISSNVTGLNFYGLVEKLREKLRKNVDLLDVKQLSNNEKLLDTILGEGIKIYEK